MKSPVHAITALSSRWPRVCARVLRLAALTLAVSVFAVMHGHAANERTIDIDIRGGKVTGKNSARVTRGDNVTLRWTSDAPRELHLHGYDLTIHVFPGTPTEVKFKARATGRFPVEIHGDKSSSGGHGHGHKPVFFLEVYPD